MCHRDVTPVQIFCSWRAVVGGTRDYGLRFISKAGRRRFSRRQSEEKARRAQSRLLFRKCISVRTGSSVGRRTSG